MQLASRSLSRHFSFNRSILRSKSVRWLATEALTTTARQVPEPANRTVVRLREYQEECVQSVLTYLKKGYKRLGISLATGSGKTVIFTQLIDRIQPAKNGAHQTLILVHRRELVEQAARHCSNAYPTKSIEIEMGNLHASGAADITIASVRSITSQDRISKFNPESFKLVLVDEAHHIVAPSYMETLRYFGLVDSATFGNSPALVGVSATLSRFDGLRLSDAIDHIVYHKDYVDMIGEKWLSDVIFTTVQSKANISGVKKAASGDFALGHLSRAVNTNETNDITVRAWLSRASSRKSTLVFCVDLAHVSDLTATFRKHGIPAQFVTGETPKQVRSERLDAFKNQEFSVLVNCGVFTEGTDIPNIDCVILARPTRSRNLLIQMIGRGMRLHPGKSNCHVIDMVASLEAGIVTTPTLFGLDPAELVKEANVEELDLLRERKELEKRREQRAADESSTHSEVSAGTGSKITFTDYDSVYDLIDDTSGERHIRGISPLAWVLVGPDRYILSSQNGSFLRIEPAPDPDPLFRVWFTDKIPDSEGSEKNAMMRPRMLAEAATFSDAVHAADTFATKRFPWIFVSHKQDWRKKPATYGQIAFLNRLRDMDNQLSAEDITKGKATDLITKIKFGARGWFKKLEASKKAEERANNKIVQFTNMRQREQIRVGPLGV